MSRRANTYDAMSHFLQPNQSSDRTTFQISPSLTPLSHHHNSNHEQDHEGSVTTRSVSPYSLNEGVGPSGSTSGVANGHSSNNNNDRNGGHFSESTSNGHPASNYGITDETKTSLWDLKDGPDGYKGKPPYPYLTLIRIALLSSPNKRLTLGELYDALEQRYPYFKADSKGWKNSIRHNLSLNKCFKKESRHVLDPGKGSYWYVDLEEEHSTPRIRNRRKTSDGGPQSSSGSTTTTTKKRKVSPSYPSESLEREVKPKSDLKLPLSSSYHPFKASNLVRGQTRHRAISAPSPITPNCFASNGLDPTTGLLAAAVSSLGQNTTVGHPHPLPHPQSQYTSSTTLHPQHPYFYATGGHSSNAQAGGSGGGGHGASSVLGHSIQQVYHYPSNLGNPHPAPADFQPYPTSLLGHHLHHQQHHHHQSQLGTTSTSTITGTSMHHHHPLLMQHPTHPIPPQSHSHIPHHQMASSIDYTTSGSVPTSGGSTVSASLMSATTTSTGYSTDQPETPRTIFHQMLNKSLASVNIANSNSNTSTSNGGLEEKSSHNTGAGSGGTSTGADGTNSSPQAGYSFPAPSIPPMPLPLSTFKTFPPVSGLVANGPLPAVPSSNNHFTSRRPVPLTNLRQTSTYPTSSSSSLPRGKYSPPPSAAMASSPTRLLNTRFSDELFSSAPFGMMFPANSSGPSSELGSLSRKASRSNSIFGLGRSLSQT